MADTPLGPESVPVTTVPFDPAGWLHDFEAAGGAYAISQTLNLFIREVSNTVASLDQARQMISFLTRDERQAIRAHLIALQAIKLGDGRHGEALKPGVPV